MSAFKCGFSGGFKNHPNKVGEFEFVSCVIIYGRYECLNNFITICISEEIVGDIDGWRRIFTSDENCMDAFK